MRRFMLVIALAAAGVAGGRGPRPCSASEPAWPSGVGSTTMTGERIRTAIKGSEWATRVWKSSYVDYALEFRRCFVRVTMRREAVGETLRVTLKRSDRDTTWREDGRVDVTIVEEAGWFMGLEGDHLFIDSGCCPGPRGLIIYELSSGRRVLMTDYLSYPFEPALVGGRWLTYLEDVADPTPLPDCPDATRWREEGWEIGFEEQVWFDLRSHRRARSGIITCSTRQ